MLKTIVQQALEPVLLALFSAVGMWISLEVVKALRWFSKKTGVQFTEAEETAVKNAASRAVLYVEEWAAKQAEDKIIATGEAKFARAKEALQAKFPGLTDADIDLHIHAALASLGMGASAAAREVPSLPPTRQAGRTSVSTLLFIVLCAMLGLGAAFFLAGCCSGSDSATCSRKFVLVADTLLGGGTRMARQVVHQCNVDGEAMEKAGDLDSAKKKDQECSKVGHELSDGAHAFSDATNGVAESIAVGEKIGQKHFAEAVVPLKAAIDGYVNLLTTLHVPIPTEVLKLLKEVR